jgi:hypothetical protein
MSLALTTTHENDYFQRSAAPLIMVCSGSLSSVVEAVA